MKNLARLRKKIGMTQIELAKKMRVAQATVAMWETGASYPSADKLPVIAHLLNCTIDELYAEHSA